MLVLRAISVVSMFFLMACVGMQPEAEIKEKIAITAEVIVPKADIKPKKVRKTAISPDVLFLLLTAEIAGQRGQYGIALDGYLRAAKRVNNLEVIRRAVKIALFLKDDKRLSAAIDIWIAIDPSKNSLELKSLMALSALRLDDKDVALNSLRGILLQDDQNFYAHTLNIMKGMDTSDSRHLSYEVMDILSIAYPKNGDIYFIQAYLDVEEKRYEQAQDKLNKVLEYKPGWSKGLLLQAQIYVLQRKFELARSVLQQAEYDDENLRVQEQIAQLFIQDNKYSEAIEVLEALVEKEKEKVNNNVRFKLAVLYLQEDKEIAAESLFENLVNIKIFHNRAAFYLGRIKVKNKHFDQALIWFDSIVEGPYYFKSQVHAVLVMVNSSKRKEALIRLDSLKIKFSDKLSELALIESEIHGQMNNQQAAFDILTGALLQDSDNVDILYARALVAERLNLFDVLEGDLKYIIEKQPNNANALNSLGYTLVDKTTRYDEAKVLLEKAMALKPNEPTIMDSYGWLLYKIGEFDKALDLLQRAYDMEPQAEIVAHLVDVLWQLNKIDQAKALLKKGLEKTPNDKVLLEVNMRLLGY